MKAMVCKHESGFEPVFFDVDTLDDLLNKLDEYGYPKMNVLIEDDKNRDPRIGIELLDGWEEQHVYSRMRAAIKHYEPIVSLCGIDYETYMEKGGFPIRDIKREIGRKTVLEHVYKGWTKKMTQEEKIAELVAYIEKELPKGCEGVQCKDCPLYRFIDDQSTIEYDVCELLSGL